MHNLAAPSPLRSFMSLQGAQQVSKATGSGAPVSFHADSTRFVKGLLFRRSGKHTSTIELMFDKCSIGTRHAEDVTMVKCNEACYRERHSRRQRRDVSVTPSFGFRS